jgi:hypothetical protein
MDIIIAIIATHSIAEARFDFVPLTRAGRSLDCVGAARSRLKTVRWNSE